MSWLGAQKPDRCQVWYATGPEPEVFSNDQVDARQQAGSLQK
jgi:hypothetical protein